jgi:hypothetical protein
MHTDILTTTQIRVLDRLKHVVPGEPMPDMLVDFDWAEAVGFFRAEATRLVNTLED